MRVFLSLSLNQTPLNKQFYSKVKGKEPPMDDMRNFPPDPEDEHVGIRISPIASQIIANIKLLRSY